MREKIRARLTGRRTEWRREHESLKADIVTLRERVASRDARLTEMKSFVGQLREQVRTLDRRLNQRRRSALSW